LLNAAGTNIVEEVHQLRSETMNKVKAAMLFALLRGTKMQMSGEMLALAK